jgi:hypothetical protein
MVEKQQTRFSGKELQMLKDTFAEKEELLYSLRKFFLQIPMPEQEEVFMRKALSGEVLPLLRKIFLPELDGNLPLHQEIDLWMTVKLDDKDPDLAEPHIMARMKVIEYMDEQLKDLEGRKKVVIYSLKGFLPRADKTADQLYTYLLARNTIIMHTEQQLSQIKLLAGNKEESPEDTLKRLKQNSNK